MRKRTGLVVIVVAVVLLGTAVIAYARPRTASQAARWVGSWAAAQHAAATTGLTQTGFANQTIRESIRTSVGGDAARLRLSNVFGTKPLVIGDVTLALPVADAQVRPGSLHAVTFGGSRSATIRPGAEMLSDPVVMTIPAVSELTISMWLPTDTGPTTFHTVSRATSFVSRGNHTADLADAAYAPIGVPNPIPGKVDSPWFFLSGIDVRSTVARGSVVVFGDSISDGYQSTVDANHRWPDRFSDRLAKLPASRHAPGVLNEGMSGNSLGHQAKFVPQLGPNALARLHRDVMAQTAARLIIVELGINDVLIFDDNATAIVGELRQIAHQAHENGLKVMICTLTPWNGWPSWTEARDKVRMAVNDYLRTTDDFDGVIDLDALLRDEEQPNRLKHVYDSGDHVHPNDRGYLAIANAMPIDKIVGN